MQYDWDLIVSSFAQQYGIRLHYEYENISCKEFRQLLVNLNGDTPFGYVVQIRAEKNPKRLEKMTNHEKKIRAEWMDFRAKQKNTNGKIYLKKEEISKVLANIFR